MGKRFSSETSGFLFCTVQRQPPISAPAFRGHRREDKRTGGLWILPWDSTMYKTAVRMGVLTKVQNKLCLQKCGDKPLKKQLVSPQYDYMQVVQWKSCILYYRHCKATYVCHSWSEYPLNFSSQDTHLKLCAWSFPSYIKLLLSCVLRETSSR